MDEKKLRLLGELEREYPYYKNLAPGELDAFPDLLYLHDKGYVLLRYARYGHSGPDIEDLIQMRRASFDPSSNEFVGARLTAKGADAINELSRQLKEEREFTPPERNKIEAIIDSPWYAEAKDMILTFLAKFSVEWIR